MTGFDFVILINTTHPAKVGIRSGNPSDYEPESFKRFGCCQAVGEGVGGCVLLYHDYHEVSNAGNVGMCYEVGSGSEILDCGAGHVTLG